MSTTYKILIWMAAAAATLIAVTCPTYEVTEVVTEVVTELVPAE